MTATITGIFNETMYDVVSKFYTDLSLDPDFHVILVDVRRTF